MTALLTVAYGFPMPLVEASVPPTCAVGPGDGTCVFACHPGNVVVVYALGGDAGADITGTCGGSTATCTAPADLDCFDADGPTAGGGAGLCTLDDLGGAADATGTCAAKGSLPCDPPQATHKYGPSGSGNGHSQTAGIGFGFGFVTVTDTNAGDCNGDGIEGDYDGDFDVGLGGAFFGYGTWANEATCEYGHNTHGPGVDVNDFVVGSNVAFLVGEDDQTGPIVVTDPDTGDTLFCTTDGSITPGDPSDPTADFDDCLSDADSDPANGYTPFIGSGSTCGSGGGDGGFWVFLLGSIAEDGTILANGFTVGDITG